MRLVKLTYRNGECVYVNPAQVVKVESYPLFKLADDDLDSRRTERVGTGSKIHFAVPGRVTTDGPATDAELYWEVVTQSPREVAGLLLEPLA